MIGTMKQEKTQLKGKEEDSMPKFRKKPVVIEAVQFLNSHKALDALSHFIDNQDLVVSFLEPAKPILKIETLEGTMMAQVGDWVIKGVNGEFYPCKPDIFEKTYEEVEQEITNDDGKSKTARSIQGNVSGFFSNCSSGSENDRFYSLMN